MKSRSMIARILISLSILLTSLVLQTQPDQDQNKGTKIIEKVVDEDGNVISERIYYEYEDSDSDIFNLPGSFDLDGLGFGELFNDNGFFKSAEGKPVMGVGLSFEGGTGTVVSVSSGSGAADVDIREGDEIISVEGVAVSSIEDVQEILSDMDVGDEIGVVVFRDGEELAKSVQLGSSTTNSFFFDMPEEGGFNIDLFRGGLIDSLFQGDFGLVEPSDFWGQFFNENFNFSDEINDKSDRKNISERATLGVFIDEIGAGVIVTEIIPDSPAERAGLKEGDVITKMDGRNITGYASLVDIMNDKNIGDLVKLEFERLGELITVEFKL